MKNHSTKILVNIILSIFLFFSCVTAKRKYSNNKQRSEIKSKKIRIFQFNSMGIKNDAKLIHKVLKEDGKDLDFFDLDLSNPNSGKFDDYGLNIFLEKVNKSALKHGRENWFIPNLEHVVDASGFDQIDKVLCKNNYCMKKMLGLKKRKGFKYSIDYIGFTSESFEKIDIHKKDYNLFIHLAGKSKYKQTKVVIDVWKKNSDFPNIVITCHNINKKNDCYNTHIGTKKNLEKINSYDNIKVFSSYSDLTLNEINDLKKNAGFVVAPSEVEGFGHYINESRGNGSIVLTTNFPPMNELIRNTYGLLIQSTPSTKKMGLLGIPVQIVNPNDLEMTVKKAIKLSNSEKIKYSNEARKSFLEDKTSFETKLKKQFIDYNKRTQ